MKKLLLLLLLISTTGNISAQIEQKKGVENCSLTSNFSYLKQDCNTVKFTANPSSNSSTDILGYYWNFGDGQTSNTQNPTHNYSNNGNYTVTLTVVGFNSLSGDCCNDAKTINININCGQNCGSILGITQLNLLGNDYVKFFIPNGSLIINSGWTNPTYNWEFVCHSSGYTINSNDVQPYVNLSNCVGFWDVTVTVTVTNSQGNSCSFYKTEQIHPGGTGNFSKISPNPVKDKLNIQLDKVLFKNNGIIKVELYNLFGTIEKTKMISKKQNEISLDVSQLKKGIYILKIFNNNEMINNKKIIISK